MIYSLIAFLFQRNKLDTPQQIAVKNNPLKVLAENGKTLYKLISFFDFSFFLPVHSVYSSRISTFLLSAF